MNATLTSCPPFSLTFGWVQQQSNSKPPNSEWKKWATGQSRIRKRSTTCVTGTLPKIWFLSVLGPENEDPSFPYKRKNLDKLNLDFVPRKGNSTDGKTGEVKFWWFYLVFWIKFQRDLIFYVYWNLSVSYHQKWSKRLANLSRSEDHRSAVSKKSSTAIIWPNFPGFRDVHKFLGNAMKGG